MQEIAAGIFVESQYAPYNLGVVALTDGTVLAVDAPPDPEYSQEWRMQIESRVGLLRYLVLSDASVEKLVSAALWSDVPLILSVEADTILSQLVEDNWPAIFREPIDPILETLAPPSPTLIFSREVQLNHRAEPLLLSQGPGVLPGDLTIFDLQSGVMFAGDAVAITVPSPALAVADYRSWLVYLSALSGRAEVRRIIPGRGKAPIFRAELEQQRELMRVLQRTARRLVQEDSQLGQRARDLGQVFFNRAGNRAVKRLKRALEHLLGELPAPESDPVVMIEE